ncbi:hypothetical protein N1937_17865 [Rhizobium sp. WSM4643]|uniref:hypothetical protein n=1 Tax=Rhizobium sp. WSM4643 TaxID=3138253 RepID=UPI0021A45D90|nr:hypothetical protein [Rhizobium leguminosarum]UWM74553.1 hypothetical protein N1937_17865 [Rhizobium leguminosarum bv. viciae]
MIAHPLPISLGLARQIGLIEGRRKAADDMAVDDGGGHGQQAGTDGQPPGLTALDMTQASKQERRETIHQPSSIASTKEAETISAAPARGMAA